jgi:hypothetical protein
MRQDPLYTTWLVRCESPEDLRILWPLLPARIDPDYTVADQVRAFPEGVESLSNQTYRLGDYFTDVRLLPGPGTDPSAFRIVFQRLGGAGRYWKDLMARILQSVRSACPAVTVTLEYRGDQNPLQHPEPGSTPSDPRKDDG